MNNTKLRITGGLVAASLTLVGIVTLGGCSEWNRSEATSVSSTVAAVEGPDSWTFVLVGRGTEAEIDLTSGANSEAQHPIDATNEQLVRQASSKVQEYLDRAWVKPAAIRAGAPDAIAWEWIPLLGDGADEDFWANGPTATQFPSTVDAESASWRGDLRTVLWRYNDDSANRWNSRFALDYSKTQVFAGVAPGQTDERNWAIVRRAADGRVKAVYVRWAVEVGFTNTANGWRGAELVSGFARLEPARDDGEVAIVDPAIRVAPAELPKLTTSGYIRWRKVEPGEPYGASTPYFVGDNWFIEQ